MHTSGYLRVLNDGPSFPRNFVWNLPFRYTIIHEDENEGKKEDSEENHSYVEVNLEEKEDTYFITADVPGYVSNQVKVSYEEGFLKISAENSERGKTEGSVFLDKDIDTKGVRCSVTTGVLTITAPFAESEKTVEFDVD